MKQHAPHLVVPSAPYLQALLATLATIGMLELQPGSTVQHGLNLVLAVWFYLLVRPMGGSAAEARVILALLAIPAAISLVVGFESLPVSGQVVLEIFWVLHPLAIAWVIGRRLLNEHDISVDELWGAIAVYVLIGLSFGNVYYIFWIVEPGSLLFQNIPASVGPGFSDFLYFSFVTLGTVGYGDVAPVARNVRLVAMFEALVGLMYIAVIVGRIVALHTAGGLRRVRPEDSGPTTTSAD